MRPPQYRQRVSSTTSLPFMGTDRRARILALVGQELLDELGGQPGAGRDELAVLDLQLGTGRLDLGEKIRRGAHGTTLRGTGGTGGAAGGTKETQSSA